MDYPLLGRLTEIVCGLLLYSSDAFKFLNMLSMREFSWCLEVMNTRADEQRASAPWR